MQTYISICREVVSQTQQSQVMLSSKSWETGDIYKNCIVLSRGEETSSTLFSVLKQATVSALRRLQLLSVTQKCVTLITQFGRKEKQKIGHQTWPNPSIPSAW